MVVGGGGVGLATFVICGDVVRALVSLSHGCGLFDPVNLYVCKG